MDRDYQRVRREEGQCLDQKAMLDLLVGRGELRTIFCPVRRRLIHFNPSRGFPTFPGNGIDFAKPAERSSGKG